MAVPIPSNLLPAAVLGLLLLGAAPPSAPTAVDSAFMAETDAAMARMHAAMEIRPTGDADADFVAMMIPHHQGAIEMAQAVLRHGRNEQVRRIAQGIIIEQQQEITAMRRAVAQGAPAPLVAPGQPPHIHGSGDAQQEH